MEELVDLVDENGTPRLLGIPRSEVKRRKDEFLGLGLYQPIVIVVVTDDAGHVVAQVRGKAKAGDGDDQIDHVCGVIASGETWEMAASREASEEIGVGLGGLSLLEQRVNGYRRHRTLATARAIGSPRVVNPAEVSQVLIARPEELYSLRSREVEFVLGFFSDLKVALAYWDQRSLPTEQHRAPAEPTRRWRSCWGIGGLLGRPITSYAETLLRADQAG